MGLEILGGEPRDWARRVVDLVTSPDETTRRNFMRRRVCLFRGEYQSVIEEQIGLVFEDQAVRERFYRLVGMVGGSSFLTRISNEVARPVYAQPPSRRLRKAGVRGPKRGAPQTDEQRTWNELAKLVRLDRVMDLSARLLPACAPAFVFGRQLSDGRPVLDVATGDSVSIIPHPEMPSEPLAYVYDREVSRERGKRTVHYVVVDDKRSFEISTAGSVVHFAEHDRGRILAMNIRPRDHWGGFWPTKGADLESQALLSMFIDAILVKKHKSQSHIQLAAFGNVDGMAKEQVLDEESILIVSGDGQLVPIDLQADPSGLLATKLATETAVASNHGVSRARLNQEKTEDDAALNERTAEVMTVMGEAEQECFALLKALAKGTKWAVPEDAELSVDYRALGHRMTPMQELEYWDALERQGLRHPLDSIFALNPEVATDAEGWEEFEDNITGRGAKIKILRALNMTEGADADTPGQDPKANGALGPQVRDGVIDEAEAARRADNGAANDARLKKLEDAARKPKVIEYRRKTEDDSAEK